MADLTREQIIEAADFEGWYDRTFRGRTVDTGHINDCEEAFAAGVQRALDGALDALLAARMQPAASSALHIYEGDCPDDTQPDSRDPLCAACQAMGGAPMQPAEPTEAMLIAARDWSAAKYGKPIGNDAARGCYAAMIAAAPQPPAAADSAQPDERTVWLVLDADGDLMHAAEWREAAHEHINEAIADGYDDAARWVVRPAYLAPPPDERDTQPCPHIRGGESSQWCELAENGVQERDARIADLESGLREILEYATDLRSAQMFARAALAQGKGANHG